MSFIYIYLKKNIYNIFSIFFLILSCNYLFQDLSFYASIQILFSFLISKINYLIHLDKIKNLAQKKVRHNLVVNFLKKSLFLKLLFFNLL